MSDDGIEGWSNGYWCCWGGGRRTGRRGSAVVRLLKYGRTASRRRLRRHTRSDRLAGRPTLQRRGTCRERGMWARVRVRRPWEGGWGTARQRRRWRGRERNRRVPGMRRSSIYGCWKDVMRLDKGDVKEGTVQGLIFTCRHAWACRIED